MKLGTRWPAHTEPPRSVPVELAQAVREFEAQHPAETGSWTLTWLENHPYAEWDAGWDVTIDANGNLIARPFE